MNHLLVPVILILNFVGNSAGLPCETLHYIGSRSKDINDKPCKVWREVTEYHFELFRGYNQFYFSDEYFDHNYCRNIPLASYQRDPKFNNASAHPFAQIQGWRKGPWCYIDGKTRLLGNKTSKYTPSPCFNDCPLNEWELPRAKPSVNNLKNLTLFNRNIIDRFGIALFSKFDEGDSKYYDFRPGDEVVSEHYKENRKLTFYIGMPLLLVFIGLVFAYHYFIKWRKDKKAAKNTKGEKEEKPMNKKNNNENGASEEVNNEPKITPATEDVKHVSHKRRLRKH